MCHRREIILGAMSERWWQKKWSGLIVWAETSSDVL